MRPRIAEAVAALQKKMPRANPPDPADVRARVDQLGALLAPQGEIEDPDEADLLEALEALGVPEAGLGSAMESLASWHQ